METHYKIIMSMHFLFWFSGCGFNPEYASKYDTLTDATTWIYQLPGEFSLYMNMKILILKYWYGYFL